MTTGTIGSPISGTQTGSRFYKTWTGGNGRTETYGGKTRPKWNSYSCDIQTRLWPDRDIRYFRPGACGNYWVNTTYSQSMIDCTIGWSSNDELKLQDKLLKKIKSHDFNLGVESAQGRQLVSMVGGNLRKFGSAARSLRRGDFASAARALGAKPKSSRLKPSDISGRWLELQYGWLPAISSTYEAAKAFEAISNGPRSATVNASVTRSLIRTVPSGASNYLLMEVQETYQKRIKYQMYEELSVARQLGLLDPLSVGWELLPWSFVVDWFIPIGTYLSNLNQIPKLRGRFLTTTFRKAEGMQNMRPTPPPANDCRNPLYFNSTHRMTRVRLVRTASSTLSVPFPRFVGQGAVHGNRVWNSIALAQQAFTGRLTRR